MFRAGIKRGLARDLVVAPYASALALIVYRAEEGARRFAATPRSGMEGQYGFMGDGYTSSRLPPDKSSVVVKSFMAHHQGMSFLACPICCWIVRCRNVSNPSRCFNQPCCCYKNAFPGGGVLSANRRGCCLFVKILIQQVPARIFNTPHTPVPKVQLLSNGRYHVMITNAGGRYNVGTIWPVTLEGRLYPRQLGNILLYSRHDRWRFWSTTYQLALKQPERYEAIFSDARVEFRRQDNEIVHTDRRITRR